MVKVLVRKDDVGKYMKSMGQLYRPGGVIGYDHAFDMSGEGVEVGQHMTVHHMRGHPCIKIRLDDGNMRVWATVDKIAESDAQRARMAAAGNPCADTALGFLRPMVIDGSGGGR